MAASGGLPEITNGCFGDAKHESAVAESRAALGKPERLLRVEVV
jgi:hypothetical protein